MSFQDLHLDVSYESDSNKNQLLDNFYIPVLENSKKYFRIAGFFSSTSLSVAAEGIEGLIKNNGKMYLLISPELSEEDFSIISKSEKLENDAILFSDFALDAKEDNLKALAWLLGNGRLEIKIVVGKKSRNSLFHQKVGIFFDDEGNILSFSGSINETAQAWINNIEEFKVFRSWNAGQIEYLQADLNKFSSYWKNERKDTAIVFDLPSSIKEKIIQIRPRDVWDLNIMRRYKKDHEIKNNKLSLFPHQARAVEALVKNDYSLLMEMATGTGKTRTAIGCLLKKLEDNEVLLTIVATPQNTLSRQWKDDFVKLNIALDYNAIIDGSVSKWPKKLELLLLDLNEKRIKTAIVFTTHATASDSKCAQNDFLVLRCICFRIGNSSFFHFCVMDYSIVFRAVVALLSHFCRTCKRYHKQDSGVVQTMLKDSQQRNQRFQRFYTYRGNATAKHSSPAVREEARNRCPLPGGVYGRHPAPCRHSRKYPAQTKRRNFPKQIKRQSTSPV